ncbi:MAG: hypothetical protein RLZZ159_686, partial [Actinomycetota bacterium]
LIAGRASKAARSARNTVMMNAVLTVLFRAAKDHADLIEI